MTEGQLMAQAMTNLMSDAVSAAAILDNSALFERMREDERNSQEFLRILRSNVEIGAETKATKCCFGCLTTSRINVREQSGWASTG